MNNNRTNTAHTTLSFGNWIAGAFTAFGFIASSAIIAISLSNTPVSADLVAKDKAPVLDQNRSEVINIQVGHSSLAPTAQDAVVYEDSINIGWKVWTTQYNASTVGPYPNTSRSLAVTFAPGDWAGMALVASTPLIGAEYRAITLRVHGGSVATSMAIYTEETEDAGGASPLTYQFSVAANDWQDIVVPLSALGNPNLIRRINVLYTGDVRPKTIHFDQVRLVANRPDIPNTTEITIVDNGNPTKIDSRMFGTNVPLWMIGRLYDANGNRYTPQRLIDRTKSSGVNLLRMPGDQWGSNTYAWLDCEAGPGGQYVISGVTYRVPSRAATCQIFDHARPSDFLQFAKAVNQPVMWTINPSTSAQEAAALVAFFNGKVGDMRSIGRDFKGDDWRTVDHWARLRVARGFNEPLGVKLWEVGNELYNCQPEFWTCDSAAYMQGQSGQNTGYWEFVTAMKAIDPSISVGAVGTANLRGDYGRYDDWGRKVIESAQNKNTSLDFYTIHVYPYADCNYDAATQRCGDGGQPMSYDALLMQPHAEWGKIQTTLRSAYQPVANVSGQPLNVAVTEFNLSGELIDRATNMTRTVNALFMADTLGQMIKHGYTIAANWALANCTDETTSTDTGMLGEPFGLGANTYGRRSHYFIYPLWQRFGRNLLPVLSPLSGATQLSLYGGKTADGKYTVMAINKSGQPIRSALKVMGPNGALLTMNGGTVDVLRAASLDNANPTFNGKYEHEIADDLSNVPSKALPAGNVYTFEPNSVTVLHINVATNDAPTATPTPAPPQPTATPTATAIATKTATATATPVPAQPTPRATATAAPNTPTATASVVASVATATPAASATVAATATPSATQPQASATPIPTATPTPSATTGGGFPSSVINSSSGNTGVNPSACATCFDPPPTESRIFIPLLVK